MHPEALGPLTATTASTAEALRRLLKTSQRVQLRRRAVYCALALLLAMWLGCTLLYPLLRLGWIAGASALPPDVLPAALANWQVLSSDFVLSDLGYDPYYAQRLLATVLQSALAASLCLFLALPTALALWLLSASTEYAHALHPAQRTHSQTAWWRWRSGYTRLYLPCIALPFLLPVMVVGMVLRNSAAQLGLDLETWPLLTLVCGYGLYNFGFCTWLIHSALQRLPLVLLDCARSLGASPAAVLLHVVWPHIRGAAGFAALFVLVLCSTSLGLPLLFGGVVWANLEVAIYQLVSYDLNIAAASVLALVQCAGLGLLFALSQPSRRPLLRSIAAPAAHSPLSLQPFIQNKAVRLALTLGLLAVALLILIPLALLLLPLLQAPLWQGLWVDATFWLALRNTLLLCGLALPVSVLLALASSALHPALYPLLWQRPRVQALAAPGLRRRTLALALQTLRDLQFMPWFISASVLALALLIAWPQYLAEFWFLIVCYALLAWPLLARSLDLALLQLRPQLAAAATVHGANGWHTWRHGCWPQLRPAMQQGAALASATMLGEFALNLFIARPEWITLSTYIYQKMGRVGQLPQNQAHAAALVLSLLALLAFVALSPRPNTLRQPWR